MVTTRTGDQRARELMVVGAVVVTAGLGLVGSSHPDAGGVVLLVGWALLGAGVHRLGRGALRAR